MANTPSGALSSLAGMAPTTALGGDPQAQQEYINAIDKVIQSLESRNKINMFNVAGAFFNPGRTGSFGEGLGNASTAIGKDIEAQQQQEPQIAMMRAQLAGQKYALANDAKALQIMGDNLGVDPSQVSSILQNPSGLSSGQLSKIQQLYPIVSQLSPQRGEMLKNMFGMGVEAQKLGYQGIDERTKAADIVIKNGAGALEYLSPEVTVGMPGAPIQEQKNSQTNFGFSLPVGNARVSSPFGQRPDPMNKDKVEMHGGIDFAAPEGSAIQAVLPGTVRRVLTAEQSGGYGNKVEVVHKDGSVSYYAHLKDISVKPDEQIGQGGMIGTVGSTGKSTGPHLEFGLRDRNGRPIDPTPLFSGLTPAPRAQGVKVASADNSLEGLPLAAKNEIQAGRVKEADKDFLSKRSEVYNYTPGVTNALNDDLKEVHELAAKYPRVFGVMKGSGFLNGLANAAQTGVSANVMGYSANMGLPVQKFIENAKFTKEENDAFARANQVLGNIFLGNVKSNKGLLGVNPTDNDARLLQAPMATTADTSKSVQFWARQELLKNYQRQELYKSLAEHDKKVGKTADPSSFFTDSDAYNSILDNYSKRRQLLQKQVGPTAQ
jgi:murein DD-endopeptidase MepM/ murein hydrolase activator NlpD